MTQQFLASDRKPEGVGAICEKVYPLLYGTSDVTEDTKPIYLERREVAARDGYSGEWEYILADGRVVVESRDSDDIGATSTAWSIYTPTVPEHVEPRIGVRKKLSYETE